MDINDARVALNGVRIATICLSLYVCWLFLPQAVRHAKGLSPPLQHASDRLAVAIALKSTGISLITLSGVFFVASGASWATFGTAIAATMLFLVGGYMMITAYREASQMPHIPLVAKFCFIMLILSTVAALAFRVAISYAAP
jgi:hypothetical protein